LDVEVNQYKLTTKESYTNFIKQLESDMTSLSTSSSEQDKKKEGILAELMKALEYDPRDRPRMNTITKELKDIEIKNNFTIPYSQFEEENNRILADILMVRAPKREVELISESKMIGVPYNLEELPAEGDRGYKSITDLKKLIGDDREKKEEEERPLTVKLTSEGLTEPNKRRAYEYIADEAVDIISVTEEQKTLTLGNTVGDCEEQVNESEVKTSERKKITTLKLFEENEVCDDCLNKQSIKAELDCGHTICEKCLLIFVMRKCFNEQHYSHQVICKICKKVSKLSKSLNNNIDFIVLKCNCKWSQFDRKIDNDINADRCFSI